VNVNYTEPTYILGHSIGGTWAMMERHKANVQGVALINAHWNARRKMPYCGFTMDKNDPRTLCILGLMDQQLRVENAVDDLVVSQRSEHTQNEFMFHRMMRHTSIFDRMDHIIDVCRRIDMFVKNQEKDEVHETLCRDLVAKVKIPNCHDMSETERSPKSFWNFLQTMPRPDHHLMYQTDDAIYIKVYGNMVPETPNVDIVDVYESELKLPFILSFLRWVVCQPKMKYGEKVGMQGSNSLSQERI